MAQPHLTRFYVLSVIVLFSYFLHDAQSEEKSDIYENCAVKKLCFGTGGSNCLDSKSCTAVVAVTKNEADSIFSFELYSKNYQYVAVGLSDDAKMGDDFVVACGSDSTFAFLYNTGQTKPILAENVSGFNQSNIISSESEISCSFTAIYKPTSNSKTYNLEETKYFLLLAQGDMEGGVIKYHDGAREASSRAFLMGELTAAKAKSTVLFKVHGSLMVIAWIGFAGTGIILARYFKKAWVGKQLFGKDLWFTYHQICMALAFGLTSIGFIVIFVEIGGWTTQTGNPHAVLGVITTALAFFQPIGAFFRPAPTSPRRPLFNWIHFLMGNSAHLLSVITLFFAVKLTKAQLSDSTNWILTTYVVFYVVVHVALTVLTRKADAKGPPEAGKNAPMSGIKKAILATYKVVACGLTIGLIVMVAQQ